MNLAQLFYWGLPTTALVIYFVLLASITFSEKTKASIAYLPMLVCLIAWMTACVFTQLEAFPGCLFWARTQLLAIVCTLYSMYVFCCVFTRLMFLRRLLYWLVPLAGFAALSYTDLVLRDVRVVKGANPLSGDFPPFPSVTYDLGPLAAPMFILLGLFVLHSLAVMLRHARKNDIPPRKVLLLSAGLFALCVGLLFNLVPGAANYPYDILSGLVCALLYFSALYRENASITRFSLPRSLVLSAFTLIMTFAVLCVVCLIRAVLSAFGALDSLIILGFLTFLLILVIRPVLNLFIRFADTVFYKNELHREQCLSGFTQSIANSLDLPFINRRLAEVISELCGTQKVHLMLHDEKAGNYYTLRSGVQLQDPRLYLKRDNPIIAWLAGNPGCLTQEELARRPQMRALWDDERRLISENNIRVFVPVRSGGRLIGILLLSEKKTGAEYDKQDFELLMGLSDAAGAAIDNARLYRHVQQDAQTDGLTGLFNHRFFSKYLLEQLTQPGRLPVSAIMLDLDNFKLYNDLYGHIQGDIALKQIAEIMTRVVGEKGVCARYGGEEFIVILPLCDSNKAFGFAEDIRTEVRRQFGRNDTASYGFLTVSAGICTYPYTASNRDELISRADNALYYAKGGGKDQSVIFTSESDLKILKVGFDSSPQYLTTVYALTAAIDAKDHFTLGHSQNVARYANALVSELKLAPYSGTVIQHAALLHDVGKIGIPESILSKPGRLTAEEYGFIKQHVEMSVKIAKHLPAVDNVISAIIGHHERWDGKGYPQGASGEQIDILSRCLCIADVFDALTAFRPYKQPMTQEAALKVIEENSGTMFDPQLVAIFIRLVRQGKISTQVTPSGR